MNFIPKLAAAILLGATSLGLAGCAMTTPAQVTRYTALPAPAGQTFYVVPAQGAPTLEFGHFASMVSQHLAARGYRPAGAPQLAEMIVRLDYGVDEGKAQVREDPFTSSRYRSPLWGYYGDPAWNAYYGRPYYSRYGYYSRYRDPFYWGWDDSLWYRGYGGYGGGYGRGYRTYTVFESNLDLDIVRRVDNAPLFQGHAKARSQTDELGVLVPNLVEAMFTGFPGRNGETVRITVPTPRPRS